MSSNAFTIALLPGDGIGPEVMSPCLEVLAEAERIVGGFSLAMRAHPAGAGELRDHGEALPAATLEACRAADAILLAAMGLPDVRYPDGTEATPQIDLRIQLGLYAGVRPVRCLPGFPRVLADPRAADLDFVLVRESTEGLFATRGNDRCTPDELRPERIGALGGPRRNWRVVARGFCISPATTLAGDARLLVTSFDFASEVTYEDDPAPGTGDRAAGRGAGAP